MKMTNPLNTKVNDGEKVSPEKTKQELERDRNAVENKPLDKDIEDVAEGDAESGSGDTIKK